MRKSNFKRNLFLTCILFGILFSVAILISNNYINRNVDNSANPQIAAEEFKLTQDLEPSTYFISPESSPGENDEVYFSFVTNRDGNYTLTINNYPSLLTSTSNDEDYVAFDNPSGTDDWYISFVERDFFNLKFSIKVLKSQDLGRTWTVSTVATYPFTGTGTYQMFAILMGSAISANPLTSQVGVVTWYNKSEFLYIGSNDNGTTWNAPRKIGSVQDFGSEGYFENPLFYPQVEVAIIPNGTILALTETDDFGTYSKTAYTASHDGGLNWEPIQNITIFENETCIKPKICINYSSGDYWLLLKDRNTPGDDYLQWAEFNNPHNLLSANVVIKNVSEDFSYNYDFYYDWKSGIFRLIEWKNNYEIINWTCTGFGDDWAYTSLGNHPDLIPNLLIDFYSFGGMYDGKQFRLFFKDDTIGRNDVLQYIFFNEPVFWTSKGKFIANELCQFDWNGRIDDVTPINHSMVYVDFAAENDSTIITRNFFITIDNSEPTFVQFQNNTQYFNPKSSDITLSKIPWDLLPSESCTAITQIYRENVTASSWKAFTDNNWEDNWPEIFQSYTGKLYILYQTTESGRNLLKQITSEDNGITWTAQKEIYELPAGYQSMDYVGTAWGDIIIIALRERVTTIRENHYLLRSFNGGESFQEPINLTESGELSSDPGRFGGLALSNNGTLFVSFRDDTLERGLVYRSDTLGINWTLSKSVREGDYDDNNNLLSSLIFDPINNLFHYVMPQLNYTGLARDAYSFANFTLFTFNNTKQEWGPQKSVGNFSWGFSINSPKFVLTRDTPESPIIVRIYCINDINFSGSINPQYIEINSTTLGDSWSNVGNVSIVWHMVMTSDFDQKYMIMVENDGNDDELILSREGRLVRSIRESISTQNTTTVSFDGIDDFGDYLPNGTYTYKITLKDGAGNSATTEGWFYVDYDTPVLKDLSVNTSYSPIPREDVQVYIYATDEIPFNISLFYRKDGGSWNELNMSYIGNNNYTAIIPGDGSTNLVEYYINATDRAQNEELYDNAGNYYKYDMPSYEWASSGFFEESETYSYLSNYTLTINITQDNEYVDKIFYNYSYNKGQSWDIIEFQFNGTTNVVNVTSIPIYTEEIYFIIFIQDIFNSNTTIIDLKQIDLYQPSYIYIGTGLLDESFTYEYLDNYSFKIEMVYQEDLNYIEYITFNYSYNKGQTWFNLTFQQTGVNFTANFTNIPGKTQEVYCRVLLKDKFGKVSALTDMRQIEFYQPQYYWTIYGLFETAETYSSYQDYNMTIIMLNDIDLRYVNRTAFRYSYDKGSTWQNSYFSQDGATFEIDITNLPNDLDELQYRLFVEDIFGTWNFKTSMRQIDFYLPSTYNWTNTGLFEETSSYSSSQNYSFTITIANEEDLYYVDTIFMNYSLDNGETWKTLIFQQNSPTYTANLSGIPEDLRQLQYQIFLKDIFGAEIELTEVQIINLYPEIPSITMGASEMLMVILLAIGMGFLIAYGYIKLKGTSRDQIHKQIIISRLYEEMEVTSIKKKKEKGAKKEKDKKEKSKMVGATPFTKAYLGILCGTIIVLFIGYTLIPIDASVAIVSLIGGLLMGVFGYMILMSRDITANIYLEKIRIRLFILELFQMILLFFNILAILEAGNNIDWFRYYLIESTYDLGAVQIPKLYVSVIGVFFTSLVLVIVITYMQLRKAVNSLQDQRREGASDNLLLYNKDQTSSRMITQMGFKTVVFLVSVLVAVISTTNLLNAETGMLLLVIMGPFSLSCLIVLLVHPILEKRSSFKKKDEEIMPFIDSKKLCTKCGEEVFLQDKFCTSCGEKLILSQKMGTYIARCDDCGSKTYQNAEFCPKCGKKVENTSD